MKKENKVKPKEVNIRNEGGVKVLSIKTNRKKRTSKFLESIQQDCETPKADLIFCAIHKPKYFSGSPIPRYSVILRYDRDNEDHDEYLLDLEDLADEHGVKHIGRVDDEGKIAISYQGKDCPTIIMVDSKGKETEVVLEHDLPLGFQASCLYDTKKYFNKETKSPGFSFPPRKIFLYIDSKVNAKEEEEEEEEEGDE